jgi:hypothetical protein
MDVKEYTVSDATGEISGDNEGKILVVSPEDPYRFYVRNPVYFNADPPDGTPAFLTVQIVMPLGGKESGLFRFPRVGEKVLVGIASNANYLMGYIPSSQDFQTDGMFHDDGRGEVFRYQQTGKKRDKIPAGEKYSEIGFYSRKTQWKSKDTSYEDVTNPDTPGFPRIDQINIQSTGDIHESAVNHHRTKAKRIEILSDVNETDFSKDLKDNRPFGDRPGDDSNLYAGDVHVRAGNRIVIKAGQEIRLQVGRSAIVISDDGITISSRKTHANLATGWDSAISLTARSGLSMFGQHVSIGAAYDFSISEAWGGSLKSIGGVVRLSGKDIKALAFAAKAYLVNTLSASAQAVEAVATIAAGLANADQEHTLVNKSPALLGKLTNVAGTLLNAVAKWSGCTSPVADPVGDMAIYMGLIQQILQEIVYTVIDLMVPEKEKDKGGRDGLNMAAMIVEYIFMTPLYITIFRKSAFKLLHTGYLHLTSDATAVLGGFNTKIVGVEAEKTNSPTAGLDANWTWAEKILTGIALGIPTVAIGGIGTWQIISQMASANTTDDKAREELLKL